MGRFLILLLFLHLFYTTTFTKVLNTPNDRLKGYSQFLPSELANDNDEILDDENNLDAIVADRSQDDNGASDNVPLIRSFEDKTELKFREPIESVNVDYSRNAVLLRFHKGNGEPIENETKRPGKRTYEIFPSINSLEEGNIDKGHAMRLERSQQTARDSRGDNFMRFGRSGIVKNDFMRFGRATGADNFMRFGRARGQDFMRFGRGTSQDFMRFGRSPSHDFMRFGRADQDNFMRFGRNPHDDFMRFGRSSPKVPVVSNFLRYSRPDNFMRFGRTPNQSASAGENSKDKNDSKPVVVKNELKQAVKLIHESDKNSDNENPVDKAIKVLFDKHQQHNDKSLSDEFNDESTYQHNNNRNDLDSADSELF